MNKELQRPPVCQGCKWRLLDDHRCERGAAPSYAQTLGKCAKYNIEFPSTDGPILNDELIRAN